MILKTIKEHKRIIFNGNGYDDAWVKEAEKRGLLNLKSTPEALKHFTDQKNRDLFKKHGVFSDTEINSRFEIQNDNYRMITYKNACMIINSQFNNYSKIINIEALTMIDMVKKMYLPVASAYSKELADTIIAKKNAVSSAEDTYEAELLKKISQLTSAIYGKVQTLEKAVVEVKNIEGASEIAMFYKETVFAAMNELRANVDELEGFVPSEKWPVPSYGEMLFSVK